MNLAISDRFSRKQQNARAKREFACNKITQSKFYCSFDSHNRKTLIGTIVFTRKGFGRRAVKIRRNTS